MSKCRAAARYLDELDAESGARQIDLAVAALARRLRGGRPVGAVTS